MRVVTLGGFGDVYTVYERGFSPLKMRAGYDPSFLPRYNPDMRAQGLGAVTTPWFATPWFWGGVALVAGGAYLLARRS